MCIRDSLGDLEDRAGLDLLHVLAVAPVPGGGVHRDVLLPEDGVDLLDVVLADDLPQADRADLVDRDHDPHAVLEDAEDIEGLTLAGDLGVLDAHHLAHPLPGVDGLVAGLEAGLHLGAVSSRPGTPQSPRTYHRFGFSAMRRLDRQIRARLGCCAFLSGHPQTYR